MNFWSNKRVLITGHTGFKGSWLSLWLQRKGADVVGYALQPQGVASLFKQADIGANMISIEADIRDRQTLQKVINTHKPEFVFHLAAQPLVRKSYEDPVATFDVNVMGTVHLLDALRQCESTKVVINVTSDKCYDNKEWEWGYRETDALGGYDPYSSSKGCSEIVTNAFRRSFFHEKEVYVASTRAGNVIGGGDWSEDRLVPDVVRACREGRAPLIRNPYAVRPWQHVLEPLSGYLTLAEAMWTKGEKFAEAWNFGPSDDNVMNVGDITKHIVDLWGTGLKWEYDNKKQPYEANLLKLDCSKARSSLGWSPKLTASETLSWTVDAYKQEAEDADMRKVLESQIEAYERKGFTTWMQEHADFAIRN